MERYELIKLVEEIQSSMGTEEEVHTLIREFEKNVPDPSAVNYIDEKKYDGLTPEQIVDKALSYKPFYL